MAEPEGYIQVFLNMRGLVLGLVIDYLNKEDATSRPYLQKLKGMLSIRNDDTEMSVSSQAGLIETLSEREIEVLQHIAEGKTNREIASQLIVASGTVKAHTASIYRKLDAKNRTEAVAIARQLNIL
jgi:LuxR family maltose regulon positive regulatory protein